MLLQPLCTDSSSSHHDCGTSSQRTASAKLNMEQCLVCGEDFRGVRGVKRHQNRSACGYSNSSGSSVEQACSCGVIVPDAMMQYHTAVFGCKRLCATPSHERIRAPKRQHHFCSDSDAESAASLPADEFGADAPDYDFSGCYDDAPGSLGTANDLPSDAEAAAASGASGSDCAY